ncbi:hypothetical protein SDC9_204956 [bioreactor metagenome]|uniref:Uncharacterized protein n=1 Tax=bioreactor metagenome TaxID=1076179 RepID=A0A645J2C1_9ZZZZ
MRGQRRRAGKPPRVPAHDFQDHDRPRVVDPRVLVDLHAGRGDVFRGAAVTGAVVGAEQIVVDRLRHAHDAAVVADGLQVPADLPAGVHGVVAAVIEKVAYVIFFEDLENTPVVGVVSLRVLHFITAGAEGGGGRVQQEFQLRCVLHAHIVKFVA